MLARLMKINDSIQLLLNDGSVCKRERTALNTILKDFKHIENFSESDYEDCDFYEGKMEDIEGETIAYITNEKELVICNFVPFEKLFDYSDLNKICQDKVMSVVDYADYRKVGASRIKVLCNQNRLPGAIKVARNWILLLGKDTPYPADARVNNGRKK